MEARSQQPMVMATDEFQVMMQGLAVYYRLWEAAAPTVEGMEARSQQPMMMPACVGLAPMCSRKLRMLGTIRL